MGHPDSPSTRWRFRKSTTATSDGDTLLPTTFLSSNNNGSAAPHLHNHEGSSERRRWRSKHYQDNYPKLFVQRNGVTTLHSNAMKILVAVGACLLFGVHLYLFRLLTRLIVTDANSTPPFLESSDSKQPLLLTPLRPIDREQYTIRINTWQRLDQLLVSIDHHASCPGVAQIQVVWCEPIDIPQQLLDLHPDKVVVERHRVNSLNERFHILPTSQTPTLGILSMDDDVLRSCEAIDAGFFQWTQSPHRMVGFDFRTHVENDDGSWKYGYLSTTKKANRYSLSLPRYAFMHRDYLNWYMTQLPRPIFDHVAESFNCEDIAMSFFISSLTDGRPPLLAQFWAIESMVKLYSAKKISGTKDHKSLRDGCVESFAQQLNLKDRLYRAPVIYRNDTMFHSGDKHYDDTFKYFQNQQKDASAATTVDDSKPKRQVVFEAKVEEWKHKQGKKSMSKVVGEMKEKAAAEAMVAGLIEDTEAWKKKYGHHPVADAEDKK